MIPVREITITRREGPATLCDHPYVARSFGEATAWLVAQCQTFPTAGYDKVDVLVVWSDGQAYTGRIACSQHGPLNVYHHVRDEALFLSGCRRPPHLSQEEYETYLTHNVRNAPGGTALWMKLITNYL